MSATDVFLVVVAIVLAVLVIGGPIAVERRKRVKREADERAWKASRNSNAGQE